MNLVSRQIYGNKKVVAPNTFIGGVSPIINTPNGLASQLLYYPSGGIFSVSEIKNFSVIGNDIQCRIDVDYTVISNPSFGTGITYYRDKDKRAKQIGTTSNPTFTSSPNFYELDMKGVISIVSGQNLNGSTLITKVEFPDLISFIGAYGFNTIETFYIPRCTQLGTTNLSNYIIPATANTIVYAHPSLQTSNAGGVDGDLQAVTSAGGVVRYVTNFTAPSPITTLVVGTVYNSAVQLNFTPPSSANTIDYYEVFVNGIYNKKITTGQFVTGLIANTAYQFTVIAVDVLYNKSVVSNSVTATTTNYAYDSDAISVNTASALVLESAKEANHILISQSKTNGLWAKFQAVYPFKGTTASSHKFNAKNPVDTNAGFRLVFSGGGTFSELGYQCNGINSFADTNFIPSVNQNVNSNGITLVCGTNKSANSSNVVEVGAYVSASQSSYLMVKNNNTNFKRRTSLNNETVECAQSGVNEARGIFTGTRQSATVTDLFYNGTQIATSLASGTLPNISLYIGGLNYGNSLATATNQRVQMVIIHEGLSDSELSTMHSIIDLSEAIAGRKTW